MNSTLNARKALVFSPSASHPQDYGNRNRVFQTTSFLNTAGYEIHFLLYPFESDWEVDVPPSAAEMRAAWASFTVLPPSRPLHAPAAGDHHLIDEWWDPRIGSYLEWLFARQWFDVFLVNYTFFSKALDYAPTSTVKILETHDIFAGRKELFAAHGAPAEFFYTTPEQEQLALDRADIVIAIKDAEADLLRKTAKSAEVLPIPFYMPRAGLALRPERMETAEELRVGFIGALNSVNVLNMGRFLERFEKYRTIYMPPPISVSVAGDVCLQLHSNSPGVNLLGRVEDVTEFYSNVDVVVAPMSFSTGIKVKVGEALSYGKPVVATKNGFDGFPSVDPFHSLESVDAVCRALMKLAFDRGRLELLEARSAVAAQLARRRCSDGYTALGKAITRRSRRIVFITDEAIWLNNTTRQARLAQWCELCTYIARTAVIYVNSGDTAKFPRSASQLARFTEVYATDGHFDKVSEIVERLGESHELIEVVLSVRSEGSREIWKGIRERVAYMTFDLWVPELAAIATEFGGGELGDIWLCGDRDIGENGRALSTTAMRYLPAGFDSWKKRRSDSSILVALCRPETADVIGVETLLASPEIAPSISVLDFCIDGGVEQQSQLFLELKQIDIPRIILAVGPDARAAELARCVAAYWGAEYLRASSGAFPQMLGNETNLCCSYADFAEHLAAYPNAGTQFSLHSADVGWSTYWRLLTQRKSLSRGGALSVSALESHLVDARTLA